MKEVNFQQGIFLTQFYEKQILYLYPTLDFGEIISQQTEIFKKKISVNG